MPVYLVVQPGQTPTLFDPENARQIEPLVAALVEALEVFADE